MLTVKLEHVQYTCHFYVLQLSTDLKLVERGFAMNPKAASEQALGRKENIRV